jgi:hypothetical protein
MVGYISGNGKTLEVWFDGYLLPNPKDHYGVPFLWGHSRVSPAAMDLATAILNCLKEQGAVSHKFVTVNRKAFCEQIIANLPTGNFAMSLHDIKEWCQTMKEWGVTNG